MKEVSYWPIGTTLILLALDLSIVIAVWAGLGDLPALMALLVTLALTYFFYRFTSLKISVTESELSVSRACIERKYLGKIDALSVEEMKHLRGAGINPYAFMALRFWIQTGVRIEIIDPRDPTPYWLISSKEPEKLIAALEN